ncbi:MAG: hypothetical protein RLZZ282_930 [Verrucomicrobiota bacterium]
MRVRPLLFLLGFVMAVFCGYWVATTAVPKPTPTRHASRQDAPSHTMVGVDEPAPRFRTGKRLDAPRGDAQAMQAGALEGQRVLLFPNQDALVRFLKNKGDKIHLLGRLDALNALHVSFADVADLLALLPGEMVASFVFPVNLPTPREGTVQPGAVALGNRLLDWLGITGDNSAWGKGVRIAILDTGVTANSAFQTTIQSINLVELSSDPAAQNGHGTAVASVIIGHNALTPGVAPGADILSIRIANDHGESNSYWLAQGIVAAVDAGAPLINISMSSVGDSAVVKMALEYARAAGSLVVAAAGNNGTSQVSYPAANPGVIAVGAVDAAGNHLDFSNTGPAIALSAPGYGVNAAWSGDQATSVTGTSFSAPIVVGSIAAIMTEAENRDLTPTQAYQLMLAYLNDGGAPGPDTELGGGTIDIGRVMSAGTPGIYDAAVASSRILPPDTKNPYGQIEILVQNRGTEPLINTNVQVRTPSGAVATNLTNLAPNTVQTIRVPIAQPANAYANGMRVESSVTLGGAQRDARPSNNSRVETYAPAGTQ